MMRGVGPGAFVILGLAILAGGLGAWIGSRYASRPEDPPPLHAFLHEDLGLSIAQQQQLDALETDFAVRRRAREAELRAANAELAAAIQARHQFSPDVEAAVQRFHHAMGKLQNETIVHVLGMRKVLTAEQAARFDRRIAGALTEPSS